MPKVDFQNGKIVISPDPQNPADVKKQQRKTKAYKTMSTPDLVALVELLLKEE